MFNHEKFNDYDKWLENRKNNQTRARDLFNFAINDYQLDTEVRQTQSKLQDCINAVVKPLLEVGVPYTCIELETVYEDNGSVKLVSKVNVEKLQQHIHKMNQYVEQLMRQDVEK